MAGLTAFYGFFSPIEIGTTAVIVWHAWRWHIPQSQARTKHVADGGTERDRGGGSEASHPLRSGDSRSSVMPLPRAAEQRDRRSSRAVYETLERIPLILTRRWS